MKKIGITLGDPSGISPEILIKSVNRLPKAVYIIYGSRKVLDKTSSTLNIKTVISEINSPEEVRKEGIYLINIYDREFFPGRPDRESGKASVLFLERCTEDILEKKLDAIVTLPISKQFIIESGFKYAGHTDYLADVSKTENYIMMLLCKKLRVALATTHIPLKSVPERINPNTLESKLRLLDRELKIKFNIKKPKIAVLGLNPHAGDGGNIGDEEVNIINPVVQKLKREGLNLEGTLSADTAFNRFREFDAYFAMYHDQGLIPLKLLCFKKAVNITLGLPFIRTSPDHGTGFDIAGKGVADPSSFIEAVKLALKLSKRY
ncbi:4-hydroxythreonine-4-phosphate dehydrogenase PdxA [Persephonella sp.]